jgi:hypothetical protein
MRDQAIEKRKTEPHLGEQRDVLGVAVVEVDADQLQVVRCGLVVGGAMMPRGITSWIERPLPSAS